MDLGGSNLGMKPPMSFHVVNNYMHIAYLGTSHPNGQIGYTRSTPRKDLALKTNKNKI